MNCLCGHFEFCEHCTPKPGGYPPGTEFTASCAVTIEPESAESLAYRVGRAMARGRDEGMVRVLLKGVW